MNIADTLRGLLRRWYIVVPGLVLAVAVAIGVAAAIPPGYQRAATQLLMPGVGTVPVGATNPYLYLGGLTQAADIVVRVMQSDEVVGPVGASYPGAEISVERDPRVSGPSIQISVTASSDAAAAGALSAMLRQTDEVLERLQDDQDVTTDDQMTVSTLTHDRASTLQQKSRLVASAGAGIGVVVLTLLVASFVDGLLRRVRRGGRVGRPKRSTLVESSIVQRDDKDVVADSDDEIDLRWDEETFASSEPEIASRRESDRDAQPTR